MTDQRWKLVRAHLAKGDKAKEKADDHYIAAGRYLADLKAEHTGTWGEWEARCKEEAGIGKSRASELMQIADGRKTVEEVRTGCAERKAEHDERKKISPLRNGENAGDSESSAEARTAHYAAADEPDDMPSEQDALIAQCECSVVSARDFHRAECENTESLSAAVRKTADEWGLIADALADAEDDGTLNVAEGTLKGLVARAKRYARERKKSNAALNEWRAEQRPILDAMVARLVALDADLARSVFSALAIRGPCGRMEGVNFVLSLPFALTLQDALDKIAAPQCGTDEAAANAGNDPGPIPAFLVRA
jgi:hypothetical protein